MPPRKSIEAKPTTSKGGDEETPSRATAKSKDGLGIEDLTLPRTMIQRLAKGVLPANTQIQKDALLAIHKSASVFVSYLADSANDRAILANKKTIQPKDVLEALAELEYDAFLPRCEAELNLYNNIQCTKRNDYRRRVKTERESAGGEHLSKAIPGSAEGQEAEAPNLNGSVIDSPHSVKVNGNTSRTRETEPATKKARISLAGLGDAGDANDDADLKDDEEDPAEDEEEDVDLTEEDEEVEDVEEDEENENEVEDEEDHLEEESERHNGLEEEADEDSEGE